MPEATYLPFHFVEYLTTPGLPAQAGPVPLTQYMSKTKSNGGNDSANSLIGKLRWMKDGGNGPTLNSMLDDNGVDLALKGQGKGPDFVAIWDFMCRNKELLKKLEVEVCARRPKGNSETKVVLKTGNVYDLYFKDRSDRAALTAMVADRFFGIDCVGFCSGFMIYNGEWTQYWGATPDQWPLWHCTKEINKIADIKPLDFMIWVGQGHIAIVDWVWEMVNSKTVRIDVCQSSSSDQRIGPQCNENVQLQETDIYTGKHRHYKIHHVGSPKMPVTGTVFIMRRKGFFW